MDDEMKKMYDRIKDLSDNILLDLKRKYDIGDIYEMQLSDEDDDLLYCFNKYLEYAVKEYAGVSNIDIFYTVDDNDKFDISVRYSYACKDVPYEQTDVDSFKETSVDFDREWRDTLNLGEGTLAEMAEVVSKYVARDVEWGVERAIEDFCEEMYERRGHW